MSENFKIDSHKLIYHPNFVAKWMDGEKVYPIEIEISPSGACNHRCSFCSLDYLEYKPYMLDKKTIVDNFRQIYPLGLRSVVCAGEGEPLLNNQLSELINEMKEIGLDIALSTNGVLLNKEFAKECLKSLTWIRFSVASVTNDIYNKIHNAKQGDLQKTLQNIENAVATKKAGNLNVTLGVQLLLLDENKHELVPMAKLLRELGVDYFTIKPFSQHLLSKKEVNTDYKELDEISAELEALSTDKYKIYFRKSAFQKKLNTERRFDKCYGLPFMVHIDSRGNIWPCVSIIGQEGLSYGNIYEQSFVDIWNSDKVNEVQKLINLNIDKNCSDTCRLDNINNYLWELKNPNAHVNFI